MAANIFDDDEAETVKNLDDLGGGRLYDNAAAAAATAVAGSQRARVSHMTLRILDQRKARLVLCPVLLVIFDADSLQLWQSCC
jgi:hypothetical protein